MKTGAMTHQTANEFLDRFNHARPGEWFVYATGHLAFEIAHSGAPELNLVARLALERSQDRTAMLTQRRVAENVFDYRITKLAGPHYEL